MVEHTPGPWTVAKRNSKLVSLISANSEGGDANGGVYVAKTQGPDSDANAAFIIRACNSHYDLIEALREARAALHQHYVDWDGEPEDAVPLQDARAKCDAAIAKAREGVI